MKAGGSHGRKFALLLRTLPARRPGCWVIKDGFILFSAPTGLPKLFSTLRSERLAPKRIRFIHSKTQENADYVLVCAHKNGGDGLKVLPPAYCAGRRRGVHPRTAVIVSNGGKKMGKGILYIVATPIGNLKDITLRAIDVLSEVDFVAAEDTRHSGLLLKHYGIKTRFLSYHEHSGEKKDAQLLELLTSGKNVALISDAGTPLISDPGYPIVKAAREAGIEVVGIPGACAAVTALSAAATGDGRFVFWGFLEAKSAARKKQLLQIKELSLPTVLYESPHRLDSCT